MLGGLAAAMLALTAASAPKGCPETSVDGVSLMVEQARISIASGGDGMDTAPFPFLGGTATGAYPSAPAEGDADPFYWQMHFLLSGDAADYREAFLTAHPPSEAFRPACNADLCGWSRRDGRSGAEAAASVEYGYLYFAMLGNRPSDRQPMLICRYRRAVGSG